MTTREAIEAVTAELTGLLGDEAFKVARPWIKASEELRLDRVFYRATNTHYQVTAYLWGFSTDRFAGSGPTLEDAVRNFRGNLSEIAVLCGRADKLEFDPVFPGC